MINQGGAFGIKDYKKKKEANSVDDYFPFYLKEFTVLKVFFLFILNLKIHRHPATLYL